MRSSLNNSIALLIVLFGTGCRKDSPIPNSTNSDSICITDCLDPPPDGGLGYNFIKSGDQFTKPCFNPNNDDEFVYVRELGIGNNELVKYSISAESEVILFNSEFIVSQPDWSTSGWVTFSTASYKVWRIFGDGSQLSQISFDVRDQFPHFDSSGDLIYFRRGRNYSNFEYDQNPELLLETKMIAIDINGQVLDSITAPNINTEYAGLAYFQVWKGATYLSNLAYFFDYNHGENSLGIYSINLNSGSINVVTTWDYSFGASTLIDIEYSNNLVIYTEYWKNLVIFDLTTNTTSTLRNGCRTKSYNFISISSDGKSILAEKQFMNSVGSGNIDEQHEIWLIDRESCEETKILGE